MEIIHHYGFLYIDLKPDNICLLLKNFGKNNCANHLSLVDFGFSCKYVDKNNNHLSMNKSRKRYGNISYSSLNALMGNSVSRKDDIESLCFILLYLWKGQLP